MSRRDVQLSVTLPTGMHEEARKLVRARREAGRGGVTIGDIYTEAIDALIARIATGEPIVFASHPRGGVTQHSIRVHASAARKCAQCLDQTTQSSFVATAMRHHYKKESTLV